MGPIVTIEWLHQNLDHPDLIILDASMTDNKSNMETEYADSQIKGSRYFDIKDAFSDNECGLPNMIPSEAQFSDECQKLGIDKNSRIVIYDNLGIYSSPRAWWMFKTMGHEHVAVLDGGLPAWVKAGHPTEQKHHPLAKTGNFIAQYQPDLVRDARDILNNLNNPGAVVIDARSVSRFNGTVPEPRKEVKSGHIPHSLNLPFEKVLNEGHMRSKEELVEIFQNLDLDKKPLIFSCGSGITACIILLACELVLPNHKAVYDGSWSEWGQMDNVPIASQKGH